MTGKNVTYKQVESAANSLLAAGNTPTMKHIADFLHLSHEAQPTLIKYLSKWKIEQKTKELEASLALVRATLESTFDGVIVVSNAGKIMHCNKKFGELLGIPPNLLTPGKENEMFGYVLSQVKDPVAVRREIEAVAADKDLKGILMEVEFKDGRIYERYSQPHVVGHEIMGRVWSFREVTEKKRIEEELRLRSRAIESSTHGIVIVDIHDPEQRVIYTNPAFVRITGYSFAEIVGKPCRFLQPNKQDPEIVKKLSFAIQERREETVEVQRYRKDGEKFWGELRIAPVPNAKGVVTHYVGIMTDITQRKMLEQQLIKQATHDTLTDLPNRVLLIDRLQQAMIYAKGNGAKLALLFLDIDHFKLINDTLGHILGDKLLVEVGRRLLSSVSESHTVARLGGDEFVVIYPYINEEEEAVQLAQNILHVLSAPYAIDDKELNITISIGISLYPKDGDDVATLIKNADISMYKAKELGRNNIQRFTQQMNEKLIKQRNLEEHLRHALEKQELYLHYQPILNLITQRIIGFEALLRWYNPTLGQVGPMDFIPIAEENGLIIPIGRWVLEQACRQNKIWQQAGLNAYIMSVNISGHQFKKSDIVKIVREVLEETGLAPEFLELELTESVLIDDTEQAIQKLYQLREMGVKVAIDDFGTVYSSLSYLKTLPIEKLKIDQSFTKDLLQTGNSAEITKAIIDLGHGLGLKVLAEGIEEAGQLTFLSEHQCDEGQGYYFSKPVAPEALEKLLEKDEKSG